MTASHCAAFNSGRVFAGTAGAILDMLESMRAEYDSPPLLPPLLESMRTEVAFTSFLLRVLFAR